jgi:membrane-associated protein
MEAITFLIDLIVHLDRHLIWLVENYGAWVYGVLFLIVFCETGLVITPFLPGDSLLFVAGTVAAVGQMDLPTLMLVLTVAAILGDTVNYWVGSLVGPKVFARETRFFKREYLDRTHAFYERHGGKTIIIARFVPIVRTFAPFVAGVASMSYPRFLLYNVVGGIGWVVSLTGAGYLFGNAPLVKDNLSLVILGIIVISLLPGMVEYRRQSRQAARG